MGGAGVECHDLHVAFLDADLWDIFCVIIALLN